MKTLAALLISLWLAACASPPPMPPAETLFDDTVFPPAAAPIDRGAALALSPAMRGYIAARLSQRNAGLDRRKLLIDALYSGDLRLEYDAAVTRTAAEAFDARSGNCLALVLMTAAFAKELGLTVRYQAFVGNEAWDRADDLYIAVGHVNLVLEAPRESSGIFFSSTATMVVDFLPPRNADRLRTRPIDERTVVAMFQNNRAVESLVQGRLGEAYGWVREAIRTDPALTSAYLTLGVVYRQARRPELADAALRRVTDREPDNVHALSNRVGVLGDLGRTAEAAALAQRVARLDPHPPFSYFHEGRAALREGRFDAARRLFAKEVERAPYHHEFEYWLAVSYAQLLDTERATVHLRRAMEVSTTRKDHDLYAGKLERMKALAAQ